MHFKYVLQMGMSAMANETNKDIQFIHKFLRQRKIYTTESECASALENGNAETSAYIHATRAINLGICVFVYIYYVFFYMLNLTCFFLSCSIPWPLFPRPQSLSASQWCYVRLFMQVDWVWNGWQASWSVSFTFNLGCVHCIEQVFWFFNSGRFTTNAAALSLSLCTSMCLLFFLLYLKKNLFFCSAGSSASRTFVLSVFSHFQWKLCHMFLFYARRTILKMKSRLLIKNENFIIQIRLCNVGSPIKINSCQPKRR